MIQVKNFNDSLSAEVASTMRAVGLECTEDYVRTTFKGQGVVVLDEKAVVGFCGLIPAKLWIGREEVDAIQLGMLGLKPGYGASLFDLIDRVLVNLGRRFCYANTATDKGAKVWTQYAGFKPGPSESTSIRFAFGDLLGFACAALAHRWRELTSVVAFLYVLLAPCRWLFRSVAWCCSKGGRPQMSESFSSSAWVRFFKRLQAENNGVMTARIPSELARKLTCVIVEKDGAGEILGYVSLRRRMFKGVGVPRYDIIDLCALGNNGQVIRSLLKRSVWFVRRQGGSVLEYVGAPVGVNDVIREVLTHSRPAPSNSFVYLDRSGQVSDQLLYSKAGWFFGPYDGDRCIS